MSSIPKTLPTAIMVALKDIRLNEQNPRTITDKKFAKLVQSIKDFPEMLALRPIILTPDFIILGGNMRYRACVEAGLSEIPCLIAEDLTAAQQLEFIIKDNVGFGDWDFDTLANEWDELPLEVWGLDLPRIDPNENETDDGKPKSFKVIVTCDNEDQQDKVFDMMLNAGYNARKK